MERASAHEARYKPLVSWVMPSKFSATSAGREQVTQLVSLQGLTKALSASARSSLSEGRSTKQQDCLLRVQGSDPVALRQRGWERQPFGRLSGIDQALSTERLQRPSRRLKVAIGPLLRKEQR
jgi:hypothetical protein